MGKVVEGLFLSLLFLIIGVLISPYIPVHADERLAISSDFIDSVSRVPFENIKVYSDHTVIDAPLRYARVASNSMAPFITDKSVVFEQTPVSSDSIKVGDIISFTTEGEKGVIMHMVVEVFEKNGTTYYRTKGTANSEIDSWSIPYENVVGVVVGTIR